MNTEANEDSPPKTVVEVVTCSSFDEASKQAHDETSNTGSTVYPVVIFRQGNRHNLAGAFAIRQVGRHVLTTNPAKKGDAPAQALVNKNRPVLVDHVNTIASYLTDNIGKGIYIIPPVTLNVKDHIRVYTGPGSSSIKIGYVVLPEMASIEITDGQHRILATLKALLEALEEYKDRFGQDGLAFMLTCESDVRRIHQDFADCSKTKQIPPSLLTVYDLRQPANGLVMSVIDKVAVFNRGKVDSTSKTIGKKSLKLFVTNQIRQMVKVILTGDVALGEQAFVEKVKVLLPDDIEIEKSLQKIVDFTAVLIEHIPVWKEASQLSNAGSEANRLLTLRTRQTVAFTAVGLNILGLVCHELLFNGAENPDWHQYATKLGQLDYSKSNPVWKDVFTEKVKPDGTRVWQVSTQRGPVMRALGRVRQEIGLEPEINGEGNPIETPAEAAVA